ncbi:universal stress protein [Sinomicrobium weinanense]|uniref:Universal stress protein n=1 Tax=Sinomicrobium weinanense TaxID=2842200 RepID=A0A926Q5X9_9FLAO|nr:universal stress protein [Sinomicrobium weinanense]MBC9798626.1 universal stress protein [Sinomicrobium weinanense]MBU3122481.1 universal stress protein [Sinomicrobium weinanense]
MEKVLLPTDFSDNAWNAITYASQLFKDIECTFYLLHVLPPTLGSRKTLASRTTEEMLSSAETDAAKKLEELAGEIASLTNNNKHKIETVTRFDLFSDAVEDVVKDKKIDIVVLGSHGAGGIRDLFLGSNTSNLIGNVKCPILAVPKDLEFQEIDEIGFALDYEFAYRKEGLAPLFRIAEKFKAGIRFYHVMEKRDEWTGEKEKIKKEIEKAFEGFDISFFLLTDAPLDVATRLFVESREIDLLCMAAEKRNFMDSLLGKSPVKNMSYHSTTPLLVLHKDTLK